jgi:hypothetical protein
MGLGTGAGKGDNGSHDRLWGCDLYYIIRPEWTHYELDIPAREGKTTAHPPLQRSLRIPERREDVRLIRFLNNGDGGLDPNHLHLGGVSTDHTLCGETLDRDPMTAGDFEVVDAKRVTCPVCVQIIKHCKKVRI